MITPCFGVVTGGTAVPCCTLAALSSLAALLVFSAPCTASVYRVVFWLMAWFERGQQRESAKPTAVEQV